MENYLNKLNEKQYEAVTTTDGAVLVLAGAGSGKTTVLANRVAYILQNRMVSPWNILAITFTNKAAREMRERIENIVGDYAKQMWIGTFHSVCVRILRKHIKKVDYSSNFVIYDSSDTKTLMKECERELDIDEKAYPIRGVLSEISKAKNENIDEVKYYKINKNDVWKYNVARLYSLYQEKLFQNNALDFDDIIRLTVKILKENDEIAEEYQNQFQYILVDEYQDTNDSQYELVRLLAQGYGNICVVGDDDQSIYKFRGANINNILNFEKDFPNVRRIDLEQNYRSTANILNTANAVIANNRRRMGKNLWTDTGDGEKISVYTASSDRAEAEYVAESIEKEMKSGYSYNDFAILYRTNSQSRLMENALKSRNIPYKILSGLSFYDRKEIKDIMAYLRVIYNFSDDVSLQRIINEPKRKIGDATVEKIKAHAAEKNVSCFEIADSAEMYSDLKTAAVRLRGFAELIKNLRKLATEVSVDELVKRTVTDTGYAAMLELENSVEAQTKLENIEELVNDAAEFVMDGETSGELGEFLQRSSLVTNTDEYDDSKGEVVLMTIHGAKGLEFPVVLLTGLEEGVFPGIRSIESEDDLEEERRLCYVAITRAKKKLYITKANSRMKYGSIMPSVESRFFKELPSDFIKDESPVIMGIRDGLEKAGIDIRASHRTIENYVKKKAPEAMGKYDFSKGERVRHRKFGDGTVISSQAFGNDAIVLIDFDGAGTKRLMAAFAKLEKI